MTRNRFNQAKHQSTSMNNLTLSKAHGLFLEDNDIDMKDTYKITNVHPALDEKDTKKKIQRLRKGKFEEVTIGRLNANIIGLPSSTINGDTVWIDGDTVELVSLNSSNISTMASKLSEIETNFVHICNKVSADTISKYNELKEEFDNNKFNQSITNIQLGDACVDRWRGFRENHILMVKIVTKYIMAILLEGRLLDKNDQERLENHYEFKKDDIMKDIESYFTAENESTNSTA